MSLIPFEAALTKALSLATEIVGNIPDPESPRARAQYVRRLVTVIARLEAVEKVRPLTPVQAGRLAGARSALQYFHEAEEKPKPETA